VVVTGRRAAEPDAAVAVTRLVRAGTPDETAKAVLFLAPGVSSYVAGPSSSWTAGPPRSSARLRGQLPIPNRKSRVQGPKR